MVWRVFAESCYSIEYVVIYIQTMTLMTGRQCLTDYYSQKKIDHSEKIDLGIDKYLDIFI